MNIGKSLYNVIKENIKDGRLPEDFSLPKEKFNDKVAFADGAMDGIMIYHMGRGEISDEDMKICEDALRAITDGNISECIEKLTVFLTKHSAIKAIDNIQRLMLDCKEWINYSNLYNFAVHSMIESDRSELIKFGMLTVEMFDEPSDEIKDFIRTLSLSDEFTIFGVFNMMSWENGNDEIFQIAQKVSGWGRIHAIERLEPSTQEIKDWLLFEGKENHVVNDYTALTIYEKSEVRERVKAPISEKELEAIIDLTGYMICEGPVTGISGIDDAEEYFSDLLDRCSEHQLTLKICTLIDDIIKKGDFQNIEDRCRAVLLSDAARELIPD